MKELILGMKELVGMKELFVGMKDLLMRLG